MKSQTLLFARNGTYLARFILPFVFLLTVGMAYSNEDLQIRMTGPVTAAPGDLITYTIIYYNAGTTKAANVVITDNLPSADYTYVSSSPAGTYSSSGNTLTWDKNTAGMGHLASLGAGAYTITVTIRAGVQGGTAGFASGYSPLGYYISTSPLNLSSTATIKSDFNTTGTTSNPAVVTSVTQSCSATMNDATGKIKSATGTPVVYLVQLINEGNIYDKFTFSATNQACPGLSFDPLTFRFLDMGGNVITGTGWLAPGGSFLMLFEVSTPTGSNPFKWSCHTVKATSTVCNPSYFTSTISTEIVGSPKDPMLVLSKLDSKDPVKSGDQMTYTIYAFNSNDAYPANNFSLTDILPDNVTYVSHTVTQTISTMTSNVWNPTSKTLTLSFSSLPYGTNYAITAKINVTVNSLAGNICSSSLSNTANALYTGITTPIPAAATTTITNKPDLSITKSASANPDPAAPLGTITYTLNYSNSGTCTASGVNITDIFDNVHADYLNSTPAGTVTGSQISFTGLADVPPGGSGSVTYSLTIKSASAFPDGTTTILNVASIACTEPESNYNNNTASASVYVQILPDLVVSKTVNEESGILDVGNNYTYTVSVVNNGEINANNVIISDILPAGLTFVSASDGGTANESTITWPTISTLAPGAGNTITRTVTATVTCFAIGEVSNQAHASSSTNDSYENDNTGYRVSEVQDITPPEISCPDFSPDPTEIIVDANDGATYVKDGTDWDATATDNCGETEGPVPVSCELGGTTEGGEISSLDGIVFNEGTTEVTWTCVDANNNTNHCVYDVVVNVKSDLSIVKSIEPPGAQAIAGGQLTYKIVVTNAGPSIGREVVIEDNNAALLSPEYSTDGVHYQSWPGSIPAPNSGTLDAGTSITLYIRGTLSISQCEPINNTATVSSYDDPELSNNSASVEGTPVLDQMDPVITVCPVDFTGLNFVEGCDISAIEGATQFAYSDSPVSLDLMVQSFPGTASDNCAVTAVTYQDEVTGSCPIEVTRTWTVKDAAGNSVSCDQVIDVDDTTNPFWVEAPVDKKVECNGAGNNDDLADWLASFNGNDACSGPAIVTHNYETGPGQVSLSDLCGATGDVTVTFTLTDACGNYITKNATFTIEDKTDPTWVAEPTNRTVECNGTGNVADLNEWLASFSGSDICSGTATVSHNYGTGPEQVSLNNLCGATGSVTVTFTLTDACGNDITKDATFTIEDTTNPTWTDAPADLTVECNGTGNADDLNEWLTSFAGSDICSGSAIVSDNYGTGEGEVSLSELCGTTGAVVVTFTLTDDCGNDISKDATFTIEDTTNPIWIDAPADLTVECNGTGNADDLSEWLTSFSGSDICSGLATVTHNYGTGPDEVSLSNQCGATGAVTVTFTLTDDCGNHISKDATFTIEDKTNPAWTVQPADLTVECDGAGNTSELNAWLASFSGNDACSGPATVTHNYGTGPDEVSLSDQCGATGAVTVNFTLTDDCGNNISRSAIFTITDTQPPVMSDASNSSAECQGIDPDANTEYIAWLDNHGGATADDLCSNEVTWSDNTAIATWSGTCAKTITITFTATDYCNNHDSRSATFTITDTQPPEMTDATAGSAECQGTDPNANTAYIAWLADHGGATASDLCGNGLTWSDNAATSNWSGTCTKTIDITFTATDNCGNHDSRSAQFTITDTQSPVMANASNGNAECQGTDPNANTDYIAWLANHGGATASDLCGNGVTWSNNAATSTWSGTCTKTITITFTATDNCGNHDSRSATFTITDTQSPVMTNASNGNAECQGIDPNANTAYIAWLANHGGATASDLCGNGVSWSNNTATSAWSGTCTKTITITFTATDNCGNHDSRSATFTITDTQSPVMTDAGNGNAECQGTDPNVNTAYIAWLANHGGATASDLCGNGVTWSNNAATSSWSGTCTKTITIIFTATDNCSNYASRSAIFTITDTQSPVMTNASNGNAECQGTDPNANTAYIAWLGNNGGATASDLCGNGVTWSNNAATSSWSGTCTKTITITFTATDNCGNHDSRSATFTITDTQSPVMTNASNGNAECQGTDPNANTAYIAWLANHGGATASDLCGNGVTWSNNTATSSWSGTCTKTITITFTATDNCANSASRSATFTITDTQAPTMTNASNGSAECQGTDPNANTAYIAWLANHGGATASDLCGNGVTWSNNTAISSWSGTCTKTITITFTATDNCSNSASKSATFTITDTQAPEMTNASNASAECQGAAPNSNTAYIAWLANHGGATASDLCGNGVTWSNNSGSASWSGTCTKTITITFTATDNCGNHAAKSATFTITDTQPPVMTNASNGSAECQGTVPGSNTVYIAWLNNHGGATASDLCGNGVTWSNNSATASWTGTCTKTITITFTATDNCSNSVSTSATFTITDTTPPSGNPPAGVSNINACFINTTTPPAGTPAFDAVTAAAGYSENCNGPVVATLTNTTVTGGNCGWTVTYTFKVADQCGNQRTGQTIVHSGRDQSPPTLSGGVANVTINKDINCEYDVGNISPVAADNCDPSPVLSFSDETGFVTSGGGGELNHGQGYYFDFYVNGLEDYTANDILYVYLEFQANKNIGNIEFTLVSPGGLGVILVGPYCFNCNTGDNGVYMKSFYPDASGYPQWNSNNNIPSGPGDFTPWGGLTSINSGIIQGLTGYVSSFEELTGPMNGHWFIFARKDGSSSGSISFNNASLVPGVCPANELIVRTWSATDACGNVSSPFEQVIEIRDLMPPAWVTSPGYLDRVVAIGDAGALAAAQALAPVATDNCDQALIPVKTAGTFVPLASCQTSGTYTNTWSVTDECGNTQPTIYTQVITVSDYHSVSGVVTYNNIYNTPMDMVSLSLYRGSSIIANTTTSSTGYYQFNNLTDGTYRIEPSITKPSGGVNSLDAGQVNYWWTHLSTIEHVRWDAGNFVYGDNFINATDAGSIQSYFVNGTPLPSPGYWTFYKAQITSDKNPPTSLKTFEVCGSQLVQNFYMLCVGDFSRNFIPSAGAKSSMASTLQLTHNGTIKTSALSVVDLPVRVTTDMQLTALSLILNIPTQLVSVEDVVMRNGNDLSVPGTLDWAIHGTELRIGWNSPVPVDFATFSDLITLRLKTTDYFKPGSPVEIELVNDPLNELADGLFESIDNAILQTVTLEAYTTGIVVPGDEAPFDLICQPNPFYEVTVLEYTLPQSGEVVLDLVNKYGQRVSRLVNSYQDKGKYVTKVEGINLDPGVYTVTLHLRAGGDLKMKTIKIVRGW